MLCAYTRPRYQVSVYRTIGPLVSYYVNNGLSFNVSLIYIFDRVPMAFTIYGRGTIMLINFQFPEVTSLLTKMFKMALCFLRKQVFIFICK